MNIFGLQVNDPSQWLAKKHGVYPPISIAAKVPYSSLENDDTVKCQVLTWLRRRDLEYISCFSQLMLFDLRFVRHTIAQCLFMCAKGNKQ
jgi:hypothetical protein